MTPPSLETAREIMADAAAKARSRGDAFAGIAAAAIDVVLAELDRRGPRVSVPEPAASAAVAGGTKRAKLAMYPPMEVPAEFAAVIAPLSAAGVEMAGRSVAPVSSLPGDAYARAATPDPCLRRSALELLESVKAIGSEIERVVNGWEVHQPGDVMQRVRATLACWSNGERAAALGVLLDPRPPERGTRARITGELARWMSSSDGKLELTTEEVRAAGREIVERRAAEAGAGLASWPTSPPANAGLGDLFGSGMPFMGQGKPSLVVRNGRRDPFMGAPVQRVMVTTREQAIGTPGHSASLLVPCVCARGGHTGEGCGWCEGTQRVTQRVRSAIEAINDESGGTMSAGARASSRTTADMFELGSLVRVVRGEHAGFIGRVVLSDDLDLLDHPNEWLRVKRDSQPYDVRLFEAHDLKRLDGVRAMSGTCSTCRHWAPPDPVDPMFDPTPSPYGRCAYAESDDGKPVHGAVSVHPVFAMDSSGYHASLSTLPTFGCNQHAELNIAELMGPDGRALHGLRPHEVALVEAEIARRRR